MLRVTSVKEWGSGRLALRSTPEQPDDTAVHSGGGERVGKLGVVMSLTPSTRPGPQGLTNTVLERGVGSEVARAITE